MLTTLMTLMACDGTLAYFDVGGDSTTTVEAGTLVEELVTDMGFEEFVSMDITAASELKNQGVEPGDISSAEMDAFSLEATAGSPDLSFLDSMTLYAEADDLPRIDLAYANEFPAGQARVDFTVTGADLTPYVVSQAMTIGTDISGRRPSEDTDVKARFNVVVGATVQGAANQL